jgi:hypothetical protein
VERSHSFGRNLRFASAHVTLQRPSSTFSASSATGALGALFSDPFISKLDRLRGPGVARRCPGVGLPCCSVPKFGWRSRVLANAGYASTPVRSYQGRTQQVNEDVLEALRFLPHSLDHYPSIRLRVDLRQRNFFSRIMLKQSQRCCCCQHRPSLSDQSSYLAHDLFISNHPLCPAPTMDFCTHASVLADQYIGAALYSVNGRARE